MILSLDWILHYFSKFFCFGAFTIDMYTCIYTYVCVKRDIHIYIYEKSYFKVSIICRFSQRPLEQMDRLLKILIGTKRDLVVNNMVFCCLTFLAIAYKCGRCCGVVDPVVSHFPTPSFCWSFLLCQNHSIRYGGFHSHGGL